MRLLIQLHVTSNARDQCEIQHHEARESVKKQRVCHAQYQKEIQDTEANLQINPENQIMFVLRENVEVDKNDKLGMLSRRRKRRNFDW